MEERNGVEMMEERLEGGVREERGSWNRGERKLELGELRLGVEAWREVMEGRLGEDGALEERLGA